jgi:hypothetical protein
MTKKLINQTQAVKIQLNNNNFKNLQLDLFQQFLCNNTSEKDKLSNTFDLWDSVPRYSVSRQTMTKMRSEKGFLDLLKINFNYKGKSFKAIIQPARIEQAEGTQDYYPSANEELIEDALRKISSEQNYGFFDQVQRQCGVLFSLYMLRQELQKRGHTRSYQQISLSLNILSGSIIELRTDDGEKGEAFARSPYFPLLTSVSRKKISEDPEARWLVQFHPLVTQSIDSLTYRQFNYAQMMSHSTQLARWLHKQLSLKFTFANFTTTFEMRFSTIKRDSALLEGYKQQRQSILALDNAFEDMKALGTLSNIIKSEIKGERGKLEDVIYSLRASRTFISEMKAANKNQNDRQKERGIVLTEIV